MFLVTKIRIVTALVLVSCTNVASPVLAEDSSSITSHQGVGEELAELFAIEKGNPSEPNKRLSERVWWLRVYGGGFSIGFIDGAALKASANRSYKRATRMSRFKQFACQFWPNSDDSARYGRAFESGYREAVCVAKKRKVNYAMGSEVFRSENTQQVAIAVCKRARRLGISEHLALGVADRVSGDIHQPHPDLIRSPAAAVPADSI